MATAKKKPARAKAAATNQPYVYALLDGGEVFYIGKGRGRRMYHHAQDALRGKPGAKCDRIRAILAEGREVVCKVLSQHETDYEAGQEERRLIACTAGLTNISTGGQLGGVSPKERIRRNAQRILGNMLSLPEWLGELTAEKRAACERFFGVSPEKFYWDCRFALEQEARDPAPNCITVRNGVGQMGHC